MEILRSFSQISNECPWLWQHFLVVLGTSNKMSQKDIWANIADLRKMPSKMGQKRKNVFFGGPDLISATSAQFFFCFFFLPNNMLFHYTNTKSWAIVAERRKIARKIDFWSFWKNHWKMANTSRAHFSENIHLWP